MSDTRQREADRSRALDSSLTEGYGREIGLPSAPLDITPPARARTVVGRVAPAFRSTVGRTGGIARLLFGGGFLKSFVVFVLLPTAVVGLYLTFLMSDEYAVETQFVVRGSVQKNPGEAASPVAALAGLSGANQDSYVVMEYIRSPAMVDRLESTIDLSSLYSGSAIDWMSRFNGRLPKEDLLKYWKRMTRVSTENLSGIVTVKIWAYKPDDALKISRSVLDASEELVNEISQRGRSDAMAFARSEVERAENRMRRAMNAMKAFMDENQIVDPKKQLEGSLTILSDLMKKQIEATIRLDTASRTLQADSPVVRDLRAQRDSLDTQIAALQATLTRAARGTPDGTPPSATPPGLPPASASLAIFEGLQIDRLFAEKAYELANAAYDTARQQADAQQVYVSVFSPPSLPQIALYPRPFFGTMLAFAVAFGLWSIASLLSATINDHKI